MNNIISFLKSRRSVTAKNMTDQNFNDEALRINRALKKKLDKANEIVKVLIYFEQDRMSTSGQKSLDELQETLSWDVNVAIMS